MNPSSIPSSIHDLLVRIQMEYVEMPGLRLTRWQACRLWTLTPGRARARAVTHAFEKIARNSPLSCSSHPRSNDCPQFSAVATSIQSSDSSDSSLQS